MEKLQTKTVGLAERIVHPKDLHYPSMTICFKSSFDEFKETGTVRNRLKWIEYVGNKTTMKRFVC